MSNELLYKKLLDVDAEEIFKICENHIPLLEGAVKKILTDIENKINKTKT
jgi:uncharacterized protein with HEPN domain